jgi:nucleoside-diphosphate-sugar epimerase
MRVLVTGGQGIIGRHAVAELLRQGADVHALGRTQPQALPQGVRWHSHDLLIDDPAPLLARMKPQALLHLAWVTEHGKFWHSPANLDWAAASLKLTRAFAEAGGTRLVASGTCAEYDWRALGDGVCREQVTPLGSPFLYGAAKDGFRRIAEAYCSASGISFAWGRIFLVYGEGEPAARLVPSVIDALLAGKRACVSHGMQRRDLMSTADCGRAFAQLLLSDVQGALNIASGQPVALREVIELIRAALGGEVEYGAVVASAGEPPVLVAEVARLAKEVGFVAADSLPDGLRRAIAQRRAG